MPLILGGQYVVGPSIALSSAGFLLCIVGGGAVAAWVRLRSGSVWPAVVFHASWNAVIQGAFDPVAVGVEQHAAAAYWLGESGLLVAVCSALVGWLVWRRDGVLMRSPRDPILP